MFYFTSRILLPSIRPALQYLLSWELRILHHYYYHCAVSNCSLKSCLPQAWLLLEEFVAKCCWAGWEHSRKCHLQWASDNWGLLYKLHYHFNHTVHLLFPRVNVLSAATEKARWEFIQQGDTASLCWICYYYADRGAQRHFTTSPSFLC